MKRTSLLGMAMVACLAGSLILGTPAGASETGPSLTGMSDIIAVSKSGTLALGTVGARTVVRDIVHGRTVRRLGARAHAYRYTALSDTGRYVLYQLGARISVVDVRTGKARSAVTTKSGARIKPAWKAKPCGEECFDSDRPTVRGALSGNGRYVAFCANLQVPTRGDLYIKDMRTRAMRILTDYCPMGGEYPNKKNLPYWVDISESGRVILIKSEDPDTLRLVLDRRRYADVQLPSAYAQMPNDGSAIFYSEPRPYTPGDPTTVADPFTAKRYDIATGTVTDLAVDDPAGLGTPGDYRIPQSMTRRGRYVSYSGSVGPNSATGLAQIGVFDRQTGTTTDLTPALEALGLPRLSPWVGPTGVQFTEHYRTLISGDGTTYIFGSANGWYKVQLAN